MMNIGKLAVALGVLAGLSMMTKKADATTQTSIGASQAASTGTPLTANAAASAAASKPGSAVASFQGMPAVVNSKGIITANAVYKGHTAITQAAQIQNIATREGVNTPIQVTDNPLEVKYQAVGGQVFTSSRSPTSDAEHTAARTENIKSMISSGAYSAAKAADLKKKYNL